MRKLLLTPVRAVAAHRSVSLFLLVLGFLWVSGAGASASDVYGNIGPAPQLPQEGLFGRYPMGNYQLDQYFPGLEVGLSSGIDASGVIPLVAYGVAQTVWLITAFMAYALITLFAFAFSLDLVGDGTPDSGALAPIANAIHNIYTNTFGTPWLTAAVSLVGLWTMWKALVQRRYTETAGALAMSLLYCVLALGIVTHPTQTIGPVSRLTNQISTAFLSATTQGTLTGEQQAKQAVSDQLFGLLVFEPWTVLEFGGTEHCTTTTTKDKPQPVAVRPLSTNPTEDLKLSDQLEHTTQFTQGTKTCINDRNKYAAHFLAFPFQSTRRSDEYKALKAGDNKLLPASDPGKLNPQTYPLGPADEPAAEAMGKSGQYQRLLLSFVILAGDTGGVLLFGGLAFAVLLAQIRVLWRLAFAPVALVAAVIPGRGHDFFCNWLTGLGGLLLRKAIYSLILAIMLAVCQALADATSNLGWLMSFLLQAALLWTVFLEREKLASELLSATAGSHTASEHKTGRLQAVYAATRLAAIPRLPHRRPGKESPPPKIDTDSPGGNPKLPTPPTASGTQTPPAGQPERPTNKPPANPDPTSTTPAPENNGAGGGSEPLPAPDVAQTQDVRPAPSPVDASLSSPSAKGPLATRPADGEALPRTGEPPIKTKTPQESSPVEASAPPTKSHAPTGAATHPRAADERQQALPNATHATAPVAPTVPSALPPPTPLAAAAAGPADSALPTHGENPPASQADTDGKPSGAPTHAAAVGPARPASAPRAVPAREEQPGGGRRVLAAPGQPVLPREDISNTTSARGDQAIGKGDPPK